MGGAGNMKLSEDKFDMEGFSKGLVEAAVRTGAWILTGGTATGVMDVVGKAMKEWDKQRQVPCIGICPFGGLTTKWREVLASAYDMDSSSGMPKVDAAEATSAEPEKDPESGFPLAAIQENHSHFIFCDNGKVGSKQYGTELQFRAEFEEYMALDEKVAGPAEDGGSPVTITAQVPRVTILFNGGKVSLKGLVAAITHGQPIVVCQGTGRIADVICTMIQNIEDVSDPEDKDQLPPHDDLLAKWLQAAVEEHMKTEPLVESEMAMAIEIVKSGLVEIYSINERLEDVILRAVLGDVRTTSSHAFVSVGRQLALAVQWGCSNYYDCLGKRLVMECGGEKDGPAQVIELIFQQLVGAQEQSKGMNLSIVRTVRENAGALIAWLLQNYFKQMDQFEVRVATMGKINWNRLSGTKDTWRSLEGLLLWSIEQEAPASVLEIIWTYMEDPVHAALVAASACRDTAEEKHGNASYQDGLVKQSLDETADRFERLAVLLLEDLAQRGKGIEYLFQESDRWKVSGQGLTCFRLAQSLGCKLFVSSNFYRVAVDLYWMTPVPFSIKKKQLDAKFLSWWSLFCLLWDFKQCEFQLWEFLSIPYIKAWTHGISRCTFVGLYSYAVFYRCLTLGGFSFVEVLLLLWGLGLMAVEIKQLQQTSFQAYITDFWNFLDSLHISVLLVSLLLGALFADKDESVSEVERGLEVVHAMNLLPCWIRVLQILQLSEYFGTLLITTGGMCKDAMRFFTLVVIFCFGFSCAITPLLFPDKVEREKQGLVWAFWTIVGELDETALERVRGDRSWTGISLVAFSLLYTLALVCNVLLVNLLIAVMNSTYEKNQEISKTEWAFWGANAVLEFDEAAILPPPLNLLERFLQPAQEAAEDSKTLRTSRRIRRSRTELPINKRDVKDSQQKALRVIGLEEDLGESGLLHAELAELRKRNQDLARRNSELEMLAANYMIENAAALRNLGTSSIANGVDHLLIPQSPIPGRKGSRSRTLLPPILPLPATVNLERTTSAQ